MTYSPIPKWNIQDSSGAPVVGGTIYFYEPGTTTPKNVYSDAGRTTSAGAELTTDANGQVGPVYLDKAAATKVVCKDADDVTLWTVDNLTAPSGSSGTSGSAIQYSTCPLNYGAIGDGAADESSEVQSAIDDATGVVDLAGKTFRCDSQIILSSGITLHNGTLDFSNCADGTSIVVEGTADTPVSTNGNVNAGVNVVPMVDGSIFTPGDYGHLSDSTTWADDPTGEVVVVNAGGPTSITLDGDVRNNYTSAASASLTIWNSISRVNISNVHIIGNASNSAIGVKYGVRIRIQDCSFKNCYYGVDMEFCAESVMSGLSATDGTAIVTIDGACRGISVSNLSSIGCLYPINIGTAASTGQPYGITIRGVTAMECTTAVRLGAESCNVSVSDVFSQDSSSDAIVLGGSNISLRGAKCYQFGGHGIEINHNRTSVLTVSSDEEIPAFQLSDIELSYGTGAATTTGIYVDLTQSGSVDLVGLVIENLRLTGVVKYGIHIDQSSGSRDLKNVVISNVIAQDLADDFLFIDVATGRTAGKISVSNVQSEYGIDVDAVDVGSVTDLNISNCHFNKAIDLDSCDRVAITGCTILDAASGVAEGIHFVDCERMTVTGCVVSGPVSGIVVDSAAAQESAAFSGNIVEFDSGNGIEVNNTSGGFKGVSITGNTIRKYDGSVGHNAGILLAGPASAAGIADVAINGNNIDTFGAGVESTGALLRATIAGNTIQCDDEGISLVGGTYSHDDIVISGNTIIGDGAGANGVDLSGADIDNCVVVGNLIRSFIDCISIAYTGTITKAMHMGNYLIGYSASAVDGSFTLGATSSTAGSFLSGV